MVVTLVPVLDFEKRLANREILEENLRRRNVERTGDLDSMFALWDTSKVLKEKHELIENRRREIRLSLQDLFKADKSSRDKKDLAQKYRLEGKILGEDAKNLRNALNSVEEDLINHFLDLPNDIHPNTPAAATLLSSVNDDKKPTGQAESHLAFENQIDFIDKAVYYLLKDAAWLDLKVPFYCIDHFKREGFIQFGNADFAKTVIVEGGAVPLSDVFELKHSSHEKNQNLLHLVGNGSLLSFLGFVTKLKVNTTKFPLKWISTGKIYSPVSNDLPGLLGTIQSTAVQVFVAGQKNETEESFNETLEMVRKLYESLDFHFRFVQEGAAQLSQPERRRIRIEMFSPHLQQYVEVGNLSDYSDYISKRLLFCYEVGKQIHFPFVIGGTVMNITRVLAIMLESTNGDLSHLKQCISSE